MKLSLATHTPDVLTPPSVSLLLGSFAERLGKAQSLGFDGVELMVARPAELDPAQVCAQVRASGLEIAAVASGPVFMQDHLTLLAETAEGMQHAASRLLELVDLAAALEAPLVTVGSFRGRLAWAGGRAALPRLIETLYESAERAQAKGVRLVLEPLNRYEADLLHTASQGLALIAEIGHPALGLLLDTFHMNIEEASPAAAMRSAAQSGRLWHVHLGDSNRMPPGQGHIDFAGLVAALQAAAYSGWLSAELTAGEDGDAAAALTIAHMRPLLDRRSV